MYQQKIRLKACTKSMQIIIFTKETKIRSHLMIHMFYQSIIQHSNAFSFKMNKSARILHKIATELMSSIIIRLLFYLLRRLHINTLVLELELSCCVFIVMVSDQCVRMKLDTMRQVGIQIKRILAFTFDFKFSLQTSNGFFI